MNSSKFQDTGIKKIKYVFRQVFPFAAVFLPVLLASCSSSEKGAFAAPAGARQESYDEAATSRALSPDMSPLAGENLNAAPSGEIPGEAARSVEEQPATAAEAPQPRKRIYSGNSRLRTENPEDAKKDIIGLAEENGGYLESVYGLQVTVRVPAGKFQAVFETILTFGEVLFKSIETYDVTDAYTDMDSRLEIARQARDRLASLLEKTDDVRERIRILKEIRRLEEEIERLTAVLTLLENRIAFSRIAVELVPRTTGVQHSVRNIPFDWIASLNPVEGSITALKGRVKFSAGDAFAVFEEERFFRAEASDGTRIRIGSIVNRPEGDEEFWRKALLFHQKSYYRTAVPLESGNMKGVLFTSKDTRPFLYLVCVLVGNGYLYVTEVFYPDEQAYGKHGKNIEEALATMEVSP